MSARARRSVVGEAPRLARVLGIALLLAAVSGCGDSPTDPEVSNVTYDRHNPPPFLTAPGAGLGLSSLTDSADSDWRLVAREWVAPGTKRVVQGSRYTLTFPSGALRERTEITIRERDPGVVDVELGPHGISFLEPVTLRVDYSGTNADPLSPNFDGSLPILLWLDLNTGIWETVPGFDDPLRRVYTVRLSHFSRYAMAGGKGGTAEW